MEEFKSENKIYELDPKRVVTFVYDLQNELDEEVKKRSENQMGPSGFLLFEDSKMPILKLAKYLGKYTKPKNFLNKTISILSDEVEKEDFLEPFTLGEIVMSEDGSKLTMKINESNSLAIDPKVIYDVADKYLA